MSEKHYVSDSIGSLHEYTQIDEVIEELNQALARAKTEGWKTRMYSTEPDLILVLEESYGEKTMVIRGGRPEYPYETERRLEQVERNRVRDLNELARLKALYEKG